MSLAMLIIKKNALLSVTMLGEIRHLTQIIYGIGVLTLWKALDRYSNGSYRC